MGEFWRGLTFWLRGWAHLLARPSLLAVAAVPLLLSLAAATAAIYWIYAFLPGWSDGLLKWAFSQYPLLANLLYYPLLLFAVLLVLAAGVFTAYIAQSLLAIPFYALLVAKVFSERRVKAAGGGMAHMVTVGLIKTVLFVLCGLFFFLLSFIPLVNALSLAGPLLLMSFDLLDYSFETAGFGLRRRVNYMFERKRLCLGMASALGLTLAVPGLTLLVAPGAVVGAALVFTESAERMNP